MKIKDVIETDMHTLRVLDSGGECIEKILCMCVRVRMCVHVCRHRYAPIFSGLVSYGRWHSAHCIPRQRVVIYDCYSLSLSLSVGSLDTHQAVIKGKALAGVQSYEQDCKY